MEIESIRDSVLSGSIEWKRHSLERMIQRGILRQDVEDAILNGEILEEYSDDKPYPSCLIGRTNDKKLHVVLAFDDRKMISYIITVYIPNENYFLEDGKTRRT